MKLQNNLKKILMVIFLPIICLSTFADNGYVISDYDLDIKINANNTYEVSEKITANFEIPKHGIIRQIPSRYGKRNLHLSNINVDTPYSSKVFSTGVNLRIGSPSELVEGVHTYKISYNYNFGYDRIKDYDEVYYNLIGNEWDTSIEKVNFKITLPKTFDASKINFTSGAYGDSSSAPIKYSVEGNSIVGYTTNVLQAGEALTLALPLPEGYFDVKSPETMLSILKYLLNVLAVLSIVGGILLWWKHGKNKPLVETVEFYPPNNMNPSEIGYYIDAQIDAVDITSLIIYWADRGYLEISEEGKDGLFTHKELFLEKKKEMEEKNSYEPYFFNSLFSYVSYKNKVSISSLRNVFHSHIERTARLLSIDLSGQHKRLYTAKSLTTGVLISSFPFVLMILLIVRNAIEYDLGFSLGAVFGVLTVFKFPLALIAIIVCFFIGAKTKRRTEEYNEILGRVRGFKRFLETAEKQKLETLVADNPQYFYNILPYTIVLGVSDKWADKFKDLVVAPPNWYHSSSMGMNMFTMALFMNSLNHSLNTFEKNMYSVPPQNKGAGGSSSMGGGFSGGGGGGGGGSSW